MKKFRFRLEPVLKERKRIEDLKLREFALTQRFVEKLKDELSTLEKNLKRGIKDATEIASAPVNMVVNLQTADKFIEGTKHKIGWKKQDVERASKFLEKKRQEHFIARQKREVIEKLKEKKFADYKKLKRKYEQKALDDLYIMRARFTEKKREEIL